jgi:hypothetical protein
VKATFLWINWFNIFYNLFGHSDILPKLDKGLNDTKKEYSVLQLLNEGLLLESRFLLATHLMKDPFIQDKIKWGKLW